MNSMRIFLGLLENVLEEGMIYAIMAMGVYISYSILDFPDLSVDGTFPLGACVTAVLIIAGVNPWLACAIAFFCGAAAGCVTGLLHVKLGITDLLSGILVMTAMWSVNLVITQGSAVKPFYNMGTVFNSGAAGILPQALYKHRVVIVVFLVSLSVKLLLDWYLRTKSGLILQASGDNAQYVTSLARDPGHAKILGLALGNGLTRPVRVHSGSAGRIGQYQQRNRHGGNGPGVRYHRHQYIQKAQDHEADDHGFTRSRSLQDMSCHSHAARSAYKLPEALNVGSVCDRSCIQPSF